MTRPIAYAFALLASICAGWLVPALAMRGLAPSLESSAHTATNFRGTRVFVGLGLVWAVWAVSLLVAGTLIDAVAALAGGAYGSVEMLLFDSPLTMPLYAVPLILTASTLLFGMADDVFGTSGDRGFRGHLRALGSGRLTTGGLKLLGIGAVSAVYGWHAVASRADAPGSISLPVLLGWWVAATLVIALAANLLNLTDLRPGRALKTYSALAVVAGALFVLDAARRFEAYAAQTGVVWTGTDTAVTLLCMGVVLLGPVAAIWKMDLGERGMLGDAGSNAMGAIVGYLLAGALPLPWLVAVALVLLGLNLLSERVSFSAVIERYRPLRLLDSLGRLSERDEMSPRE